MSEIKNITDLTPAPRNANQGTPRGRGMIEQSVRQRGAGRSGLAAKDGTMIAGSQTLDVMAELGMPIRTIHTNGDEWVVVVRDDLEPDSEEAELLGLDDNRAAELGLNYDAGILAEMAEQYDLSSMFFPHELAVILEHVGDEIIDAADLWKGMPDFEQEGVKPYKDLIIHFETREDYEEFARIINRTLTSATKSLWYPERPEELKGQTSKDVGWTHES
jgi:hypothetical protein